MKQSVFLIVLLLTQFKARAQYTNIEASTGGFSFIPAFTSDKPHFIVNAGTTDTKRLSFHLLSTIRSENFNPRGIVFITRYKLIDKKFKASFGIHLPSIQIDDSFKVNTFFAQEFLASYPLSSKLSLGLFYLHGEGKNFDFKANFLAFSSTLVYQKVSFLTQAYVLDLDNTYGVSQTLAFKLTKKIEIRGFVNKTLSDGKLKWTLGTRFNL